MTGDFINYTVLLEDFRALIEANLGKAVLSGGFVKVFKNAQDTDFDYVNMPMADCRIRRADPLNIAGQQYYSTITIEVEIACFDMTSRDKCATIRDQLTNLVQRLFQQNPHFSANVDSIQIGVAEFETGETKAQGEFIAATVAQFFIKRYAES